MTDLAKLSAYLQAQYGDRAVDGLWCNVSAKDMLAILSALRTGQLVERDGAAEIARYLIDQQDEPFPDGSHKADSDRLHYWRDKCIYGARRLTAIKGGGDA